MHFFVSGQGNASDYENATSVEIFVATSTASVADSSSTLNASTTPNIPPSNTTTNDTLEGPLFFNSTNGTSVPLVAPTSAPTQGSAGGGGQRFDVASFIGGIILAVGVTGLGIFIFKVYQSRQSEYSNI